MERGHAFARMKYFTVDQANKTLPLVRRVVSDIVDEHRRWKDFVFRYELLAASSKAEEGESADQVTMREMVDQSARKITAYQAELTGIGCVFKGFEDGLVDFHHQMDGRDVLLCWRLGEDKVEHWHEVEDGFAGRQVIEERS
ncbi:MAG: DUF2203 family protein [Gemmatimonadetes bacterium]|nr:DUF2203 family protein [Gemmatimonadota bacterium]